MNPKAHFLRSATVSVLAALLSLSCGAEAPTPSSSAPAGANAAGTDGTDPGTAMPADPGATPAATDPNTGAPVAGDPGAAPTTGTAPSGGVAPGDDTGGIILDDGDTGAAAAQRAGIRPGDAVDLLFVVDNSTSMGDKQALFVDAIPDLIDMLVNPPCLDRMGDMDDTNDALVPFEADGSCPEGTGPAFAAVTDVHIGVISSSLGAHGLGPDEDPDGIVCPNVEHQNDAAHLIGFKRSADPSLLSESWSGWGFLVWDPNQQHPTAVGDSVKDELVRKFQVQVAAVGEKGCGFEAPLEAAYRFLVEPAPYATLDRVPCSAEAADANCVQAAGVDQDLLNQRAAFLRPDSHLVVTYLTDENDCSIRDSLQGYYTLRPLTPMARGTTACATDPNDQCCQSCLAGIRDGCPTDPATNGCTDPKAATLEATPAQLVEAFNVRCFAQKQRFGIDLLYSPTRYLAGFQNDMIDSADGTTVPNPLFAGGRDKDQVFVVGIVGTPWQDVSVDVNDPSGNVQRAGDLPWEWFLPSDVSPLPMDPFNIEAMGIRQGTHPVTGDVLDGPGTSNTINGHDREIVSGDGLLDDLQYACTFELPEPRDCTADDVDSNNCDCTQDPSPSDASVIEDYATGNPLCQAPDGTYGTTQYRAKAYPSPRVMEVVRGMGDQGVLGSICPQNPTDPSRQDYGYRPPIRALLLGLARPRAR